MLPPVVDEVIASPTLLARADEVKRLSIRRPIVVGVWKEPCQSTQIEPLENSTFGVRIIGAWTSAERKPVGRLAAAVGLPKARPQGTALRTTLTMVQTTIDQVSTGSSTSRWQKSSPSSRGLWP
jgi:hypothetical protein